MKKNYQKPQIRFESFELSQDISAGCELISNHGQGACVVLVPEWDMTLYINEMNCDATAPDYGDGDGLCYHAPSDSYNVYSS